ncbi:hypothetical protein IT774_10505 [Salinimonas marina]|uniref:Uncharacterized protein n=1 Tax=Salinimonas marina TaxID=2785918 RepID=A0A7S9DVG3_9ALTE|nr:hypothetical protein [Salinimonas marina]QPG04658.1 hypothetical protein IT774_10505 [Salinimonas marina]
MKHPIILILTSLLVLTACTGQAQTHPEPVTEQQKDKGMNSVAKQMTGTIVYKNLEGGFYGFISDEGDHYTLRNLAPEYKQNGLKISVKGQVLTNIMTITQFGDVFEVSAAKVVDRSGVKPTKDEM